MLCLACAASQLWASAVEKEVMLCSCLGHQDGLRELKEWHVKRRLQAFKEYGCGFEVSGLALQGLSLG